MNISHISLFSFTCPSVSNYSTLGTGRREDYDYATLNKSEVPVSEEELEKETGAGPRGDRSRVIETDQVPCILCLSTA